MWDSVQAVCSYLRGIMTSTALFEGIGVGKGASRRASSVCCLALR
jgi:hypothetical protein